MEKPLKHEEDAMVFWNLIKEKWLADKELLALPQIGPQNIKSFVEKLRPIFVIGFELGVEAAKYTDDKTTTEHGRMSE